VEDHGKLDEENNLRVFFFLFGFFFNFIIVSS
jgi:hypothetical protein